MNGRRPSSPLGCTMNIWSSLSRWGTPLASSNHSSTTSSGTCQLVIAYIHAHIQHMCRVLSWLLENHLFGKEEKFMFHLTSISFLVYVISPNGIAMDDKMVDAVINWPIHNSIRELQRFLGFAIFYLCPFLLVSLDFGPLLSTLLMTRYCVFAFGQIYLAFHPCWREFQNKPAKQYRHKFGSDTIQSQTWWHSDCEKGTDKIL